MSIINKNDSPVNILLRSASYSVFNEFQDKLKKQESVENSRVLKVLDSMIEKDTFSTTIDSGTVLFRARSLKQASDIKHGFQRSVDERFYGFD